MRERVHNNIVGVQENHQEDPVLGPLAFVEDMTALSFREILKETERIIFQAGKDVFLRFNKQPHSSTKK